MRVVNDQEVHHLNNVVVEGLAATDFTLGVYKELAELILFADQFCGHERVFVQSLLGVDHS